MTDTTAPSTATPTGDADEPFRATLRRRVRVGDCLALALVPLAATLVFLLPEGTRRSLAFAYREPTVASAYAAHFVHLSADHLLANLLGYALLAGTGYLLAALSDARRLFGVAAATYLLAFPFALSALNLAVPRDAVGYGLSGLNMAFLGLLPVLLAVYAGRRLHPAAGVRHAPGAFLLTLATAALRSVPTTRLTAAIAAAAALGAVGYAASFASAVGEAGRGAAPTAARPGWADLFALGAVLLLAYPFVAFPTELRVGAAVVNAYVHLLGFCLAFLVAYVACEAGVVGGDA